MDKEMEIKICEKLNQLTPGQEFKSFKALCDFFEIQASGGNKRIAQKKLIEKYCRLRKVDGTNKYIIEKIYDTPKELIKQKRDLSALFPSEQLLLTYLATSNNNIVYIPTPKLWTIFSFVNAKFFRPSYEYIFLYKYNMYGKQIENFKQRCYKRFHQLTFFYLKDLVKRGLIEYDFTNINECEDGYYCTLNQRDKIFLENKVKAEKLQKDAYINSISTKKEKICKGFIIKAKTNLDKYVLTEAGKKSKIKKANDSIVNYVMQNARNRYDNYKRKQAEIKNMPLTEFPEEISWSYLSGYHVYTDTYLECQSILTMELIKIN